MYPQSFGHGMLITSLASPIHQLHLSSTNKKEAFLPLLSSPKRNQMFSIKDGGKVIISKDLNIF